MGYSITLCVRYCYLHHFVEVSAPIALVVRCVCCELVHITMLNVVHSSAMHEVGNPFHPVASERSKDLFDEAMKDGYGEPNTIFSYSFNFQIVN